MSQTLLNSVLLTRVKLFKRFQLLDQSFVLILQHCYSVLKTLDILLLLVPALSGRLPVLHKSNLSFPGLLLRRGHICTAIALNRDQVCRARPGARPRPPRDVY